MAVEFVSGALSKEELGKRIRKTEEKYLTYGRKLIQVTATEERSPINSLWVLYDAMLVFN